MTPLSSTGARWERLPKSAFVVFAPFVVNHSCRRVTRWIPACAGLTERRGVVKATDLPAESPKWGPVEVSLGTKTGALLHRICINLAWFRGGICAFRERFLSLFLLLAWSIRRVRLARQTLEGRAICSPPGTRRATRWRDHSGQRFRRPEGAALQPSPWRRVTSGIPLDDRQSQDHCVRDDDELERIVNYVHANPVVSGLVKRAD